MMSLNEAIIKALCLDPTIRKSYSDVTEANGYMREVRSDLRPQLRLEGSSGQAKRSRSFDGIGSGGHNLFSREIGLVFEQLIYDGGFGWYRWKDAEKRLEGTKYLDIAQREMTTFATIEAYLDVIKARKQVGNAKANVAIHRKIRDLAKARAEAIGNNADTELSRARFSLAEIQVRERELAVREAEKKFFRYVGRTAPELVMPKIPEISSKAEVDPTKNYHYIAAVHQREAARHARTAVQSRSAPKFFLRGAGRIGEDVQGIRGEDNEVSTMVVVQWDLLDGGRREGLITQAIADIDRQQAVIDETLVLLQQDIDSRWEDYSTMLERLSILKDYSSELKKTVALYEEQFDLGTRPLLSILDVQNEEISAAIRLNDEQYDFDLDSYRFLFFGGRLISCTVGQDFLITSEDDRQKSSHPWAELSRSESTKTTVPPEIYPLEIKGRDVSKSPGRPFGNIFRRKQ